MKSSTKNIHNTFLLSVLVVLAPTVIFAKASRDESPNRRRFNNYTNIAHRDWNLTLSAGASSIVTFKKDNYDLSVYKKDGKAIFELNLRQPETMYEVFAKGNQVGVLVTPRETMFNEDACTITPNPFTPFKNEDLGLKIEDLAYSDSFFGGTCGSLTKIEKTKLRSVMTKELSPNSSQLISCLSSDSFAKQSSNDTNLQQLANKLITRYVDELTKIQNGASELKIECAEGEIAKFDPKRSALIFPIKDSKIVSDACKSMSKVFGHEFSHYAGLPEDQSKVIDNNCPEISGNKDKCGPKEGRRKDKGEGASVAAAIAAQNKKEVKAQQKAIEPVLVAEIKTADFVPVKDADIKEITNPTSTPTYEASVERVHKAMSSNMERMAAPLNRAIASTVSTARADSTTSSAPSTASTNTRESISKTTIAGLRQPASAKSNGNQEYVVEEILADKYNVPVETIKAAQASSGVTSAPAANVATKSVQAPNRGAAVATKSAGPAGGDGELATGNSGRGGGGGESLSTPGGVAGRSVSSGAQGNSRLPASTDGVASTLVEQLGQFNEVRGKKYQEIQDRYGDPTFEPQLINKNIAIEYHRNNKTFTIGDKSNKRTLFRDDGTVLKKVTGAR